MILQNEISVIVKSSSEGRTEHICGEQKGLKRNQSKDKVAK